ncbi:hypothetical protein [Bosea lupini]|uniref:hypothetical protein n=1 Tax=Bosea lupini TaxID=1036779 RepID=UPI001FCDC2A6|nr:hypothetical protein [Bosea lupini]
MLPDDLGALVTDSLQEQIVCLDDLAVEIKFDDGLPTSNRQRLGGRLCPALFEKIHSGRPLTAKLMPQRQ